MDQFFEEEKNQEEGDDELRKPETKVSSARVSAEGESEGRDADDAPISHRSSPGVKPRPTFRSPTPSTAHLLSRFLNSRQPELTTPFSQAQNHPPRREDLRLRQTHHPLRQHRPRLGSRPPVAWRIGWSQSLVSRSPSSAMTLA